MADQHQTFWDISQDTSKADQERNNSLLKAAVLGHCHALCSLDEGSFTLAKGVLKQQKKIRYYKKFLEKNGSDDQISAFNKIFDSIEKKLLSFVDKHNKLPNKQELKLIFAYEKKYMPWYKALMLFISDYIFFIHKIVYGRNNMNAHNSIKIRNGFIRDVKNAEQGRVFNEGEQKDKFTAKSIKKQLHDVGNEKSSSPALESFSFSEHMIDTKKCDLLNTLRVSRTKKGKADAKDINVVIYFGGRSLSFIQAVRYILNLFWSLPSADELWFVNSSDRSILSSQAYRNDDVFIQDVDRAYEFVCEYYKDQNKNVNITMVAHCAGAPAVASFASNKKNIKFFSDRSFLSINDVATSQLKSLYQKMSLFGVLLMYALAPIRALRSFVLKRRGYSLNQGKSIKTISPYLRDTHSIQPPKHDKDAAVDSMHLGKGASLLLAFDAEDKRFDDAFLRIVTSLTQHTDSTQTASQAKARKNSAFPWFASSHKANKQNNLDVMLADQTVDLSIKDLLTQMLKWHKDRKSYIPSKSPYAKDSRGVKKDPHLQWPSELTGRGTGKNPFWRLNMLVACTQSELQDDLITDALQKDVAYCVEHTKPLIVTLCKDSKYKEALQKLNNSMKSMDSPINASLRSRGG